MPETKKDVRSSPKKAHCASKAKKPRQYKSLIARTIVTCSLAFLPEVVAWLEYLSLNFSPHHFLPVFSDMTFTLSAIYHQVLLFSGGPALAPPVRGFLFSPRALLFALGYGSNKFAEDLDPEDVETKVGPHFIILTRQ